MDINILQKKIIENLTPDLLKGFKYNPENSLYGFCYVASEALYHLWGKEHGYYPVHGRDEEGVVHWWLENEAHEKLDITAPQYWSVGKNPPYSNSKRGGFLTGEPSKRARILMERVLLSYYNGQ